MNSEDISGPNTTAREEHREYQLLAESIPNLAWMAEADGSIYWYNRRWYEYTGTTPGEMEGWGWQAVHDPATLPSVLTRWRACIGSGEPFEMTFPLRAADGSYHPFLTRVVPLKDEEGVVLRWFGTNTDIEEERRTLAALRESEQRFRIATEAVSGILWTNDPNGEMQGEQPGWAEFTGQTGEQYCGYGWAAAVHPDDAQPTIKAWQAAVAESRLFSFEHRVLRKDGVYRLCGVRALPVRNADGSVREWVGVHTDITEDRERQQALGDTVSALRRQEEMVEAAQISNSVGFWRYEPASSSIFLSSGSRHLLGMPAEGPATLEDSFARVHPEDAPRIHRALEASLTSGRYCEEFRAATSVAEEYRWILGTARSQMDSRGQPYLVGMNLDITQQKQSAEVLIRTEKLAVAGRLAASIAHEINNPLEAITNLLYLLSQTQMDAEQRSYCVTMQDELQRVSEIATHTLRFHRQSTRANQTKIETLIHSVLALFDGRIRNAGIVTRCKFAATAEVFGFDGELRQVLANLAGNAVDAMGAVEGRRVLSIRTHQSHSRTGVAGVTITVGDTGSGISATTLKRIFDPFFTTKGEIGTGLGLWVSSEIVRKHQGEIRVRSSRAEGRRGSVFRLFLPLSAEERLGDETGAHRRRLD